MPQAVDAVTIDLPRKLEPVFDFSRYYRYRGAHGGRGSAKSRSFALGTALRGYQKPLRILCAREIQKTIKDSVISEVIKAIEMYDFLKFHYEWGDSYIRGRNGTEYLFKGLRHNSKEIKSTSEVDLCWIEEADAVSESSWRDLIPTIRNPESEIWLTWNPFDRDSATDRRFIQTPPSSACIVEMNWRDNPWFPDVLEMERQDDLRLRPDIYDHVWDGAYLEATEAQVFKGKYVIADFKVDETFGNPLHGMDFGFARDPTTAIRLYIKDRKLWIRHEAYKVKLELDDTTEYIKACISGIEKYACRADSARPESISYLKRHGLPKLEGVKKWQGSIEDGVDFIKSFEQVVIHPDCIHTAKEFKHYSYKIDPNTEDVLPIIVDAWNHIIDPIRYALTPMMKNRQGAGVSLVGLY